MAMKGAKAHIGRLLALPANTEREVGAALFAGGELIEVDAAHSITAGSVSGKYHVPAGHNEPPNADTHVLDRNIETTQPSRTVVQVSSNAPYSARHEFGPEGRAFLRPARDRNRKKVQALVQQALNRANKRSRSSDQ